MTYCLVSRNKDLPRFAEQKTVSETANGSCASGRPEDIDAD